MIDIEIIISMHTHMLSTEVVLYSIHNTLSHGEYDTVLSYVKLIL